MDSNDGEPLGPITPGPTADCDEIEDGVLEGPRAQCDVKLARTPGEFSAVLHISLTQFHVLKDRSHARDVHALADELNVPDLHRLIRLFLYDQFLADDTHTSDNVPLSACPRFENRIKIFNSAAATFFAPSDPSGIGGMRCEHIRSVPSWRGGPARYDTVFINTASEDGINGMEVGRCGKHSTAVAVFPYFPSTRN